jgi:ABC-type antimicrobial peptide transport system permease subunit
MHELSKSISRLAGVEATTVRSSLAGFRSRGADSILSDQEVFRGADRIALQGRDWLQAQRLVVEPHYFSTLQISLLRGRRFVASDSGAAARMVILSARAAQLLWPSEDPLGKSIHIGSNGPALTVIGVVGDVFRSGFGPDGLGAWPVPTVYLTNGQAVGTNPTVQVRVRGDPEHAGADIGNKVMRAVGAVPFFVRTPAMERETMVLLLRTCGVVFGTCATIACLLAALGVYAVISFRVTRQTREIGIRSALGATTGQIRWGVARDCGFHGGLGLIVGVAISALLAHLMRSAIWGISPLSPLVYTTVAGILSLLVGLGGFTASGRATSVDPAAAIRTS